jgi:RNA polymerase sigma-70 factor (ECF subfamily)
MLLAATRHGCRTGLSDVRRRKVRLDSAVVTFISEGNVEIANASEVGRTSGTSDAELVAALRSGDPAAQAAAWARLGRLARRVVGRFFGPGLDPSDMVQEVFIRVFARLDELRDPACVRGFVIGIALGVARNQARRARLRRMVGLTTSGDAPEVLIGSADMEARQVVRRLYVILDDARAEDRSLFVARFMEKMEMTEIAEAHKMSFGTAKRRVARAIERITRRIARDRVLADYLNRAGGLT